MRRNFVAAIATSFGEARTAIEDVGVQQRGRAQIEPVEQIEQPPRPDPVAVIVPRIIHDIGVGLRRRELRTQATAKVENLVIDAEVDRQSLALGPVIVGAIGDRAVGIVCGRQALAESSSAIALNHHDFRRLSLDCGERRQ